MAPSDHLPRAAARRRLLAAAAVVAAGTLLGSTPADAGDPARDVTMRDNRFDPVATRVEQGQSVEFTNFGGVVHDARDGTGLDLFATELMAPPESVTIGPLPGAGDYRYYCTFHPEMVGRLRVPLRTSRAALPAGGRVAIRWAAERAPSGLVFDVQRRRPGADRFVDWRVGAVAAAATFRPSVPGSWVLRARVRSATGVVATGWSPGRTIQVAGGR